MSGESASGDSETDMSAEQAQNTHTAQTQATLDAEAEAISTRRDTSDESRKAVSLFQQAQWSSALCCGAMERNLFGF